PVLDPMGGITGVRVVPGSVAIHLVPDDDVIVARSALPRADGVRLALAHVFAAHGLRREVVVALDDLGPRALGDHGAVPQRSRHRPRPTAPGGAAAGGGGRGSPRPDRGPPARTPG